LGTHTSKTDRATLTHAKDIGYDLVSVLMVRGDDGATIAPVLVSLTTADGVLSTRDDPPAQPLCHIDQVLGDMQYVRGLDFATTIVHAIDREADSVNHWRQWSADGHLALVRADNRIVLHAGQETTLDQVANGLRETNVFKDAGDALYQGRPARLFIAETEVVLHRPGKRKQGEKGKKKMIEIPGPPLPLRLVVTEVRDAKGERLATWLLLSNVPIELGDMATIAKWYYFRWRIESMHKLLKSAGMRSSSATARLATMLPSPNSPPFRGKTACIVYVALEGYRCHLHPWNPRVEGSGAPDSFDELLERIRDIRVSERRMHLRVKEIFALAADYNASQKDTVHFFKVKPRQPRRRSASRGRA
jgi:hypothetical protein